MFVTPAFYTVSRFFKVKFKVKSKIKSKLKFKLNVNENENDNRNESGGACAGGAKRPRVGVFTRCVFVFVFVSMYVQFDL